MLDVSQCRNCVYSLAEGEDRNALEGEVSRVLCLAGLRGRKTTVEYTVSMVILV